MNLAAMYFRNVNIELPTFKSSVLDDGADKRRKIHFKTLCTLSPLFSFCRIISLPSYCDTLTTAYSIIYLEYHAMLIAETAHFSPV
jgi:hypothetical protein